MAMLSFAEAQRILAVLDDAMDKLALSNLVTNEVIDNTLELQNCGAAPSVIQKLDEMRKMRERVSKFPRVSLTTHTLV